MSSENQLETAKIAIALRAGRAALGWSQQEFCQKLNIAKSSLARIETLEMSPKADLVTRAMTLFREAGLEVDLYKSKEVSFNINELALSEAVSRLQDDTRRRSDRAVAITFQAKVL